MQVRKYASIALAALALAAPASARGADPQTFLDHAANWTERQGFPVGHAPLRIIDTPEESGAAWAWGGGVPRASSGREGVTIYATAAAPFRRLAERYGTRGRLGRPAVVAAQVTLHELLHRVGHRDWYAEGWRERVVSGQTMAWWEEAGVEAVSLDLLPAFLRELYGHRVNRANADLAGAQSYAERARTVRQLSTYATASANYAARAATAWRARLVRARWSERAEMIAAAYAARDEAAR